MSISKVDIANFGSFKDFVWKSAVRDHGGDVLNFKRLNIIYGRNYSGKTTLSRIFRTLQTGIIPDSYSTSSFIISGDKGEVNQSGVSAHNYVVRVYNRDFVDDNLSFLVNQDGGEIKTFAIVGGKNKEVEDAITAIEAQLGSVEEKSGLKHELEIKRLERDRAKENYKKGNDTLTDKLRTKAKSLKENKDYVPEVYTIRNIQSDIEKTNKPNFKKLSQKESKAKADLLKQEVLPEITDKVSIKLKLNSLVNTVEELLQRTIKPTQAIQELLDDRILQLWVKEGMPLHRDKHDTCAFCRQKLPHDIWQILDSHFSKESIELESEIDLSIASVDSEIRRIPTFLSLTSDKFYSEEKSAFDISKKTLDGCLEVYKRDLESLKLALHKRKNSLFQLVVLPIVNHDAILIEQQVERINELIERSNRRSKTLDKDKINARETLRLSDVASFVSTIGYDAEMIRITELKTTSDISNAAFVAAENEIIRLESEVTALRREQKDERKGADRVNALLNHFFGHDGIKLEAQDNHDKTAVKFQIMRDGKSAYNLSEGECSLIAFCYFIAKLEEPESKDRELIIYIDDPVSSLDGNHIFFMFSLIESLIAKPIKNNDGSNRYRYKQLFISTHNLDFLKYLKKISLPNEKNHGGHQHFMIERNGASSNISLMPTYLKDYITEFNYLFHQIYKCRDQEIVNTNYEPFYSFGNNLRKFLEAFLFYKYPYHDDKNDAFERIKKFFGDDDTAIALANRLNNELSHLESIFDRSIKPIEIPEIPKLANYVLDKIYTSDPDQYNSLLKSIGEPERTT
ncbi:wobble nucleotide-excising tRNase [Xenorhabdus cabanillasii]|uniref:Wobble nucleotide-excising tRNase n=1 Tax=Xenorhabdus cabanillasii TaxID=351673 RepID=A0A3D9UKY7_9GAMM|nr:AAA family ATPase [Xenorhabdus cabanillasii]REF27255.1 wobble nucleotide-excising tRNase [Xenorhabdus cabanillasii]